jgi:hypothetical protein
LDSRRYEILELAGGDRLQKKRALDAQEDLEARREYHREYIRKWYARNKELQVRRVRAATVKRRNRLGEWIDEFKRRPCADCGGEFPPYLMDFDHVRGEKLDNICGMRMRTMSREAILAEIEKCEVVCATCHRARTHARRLGLEIGASEFVKTFSADYVSVLVY